MDEQRDTLGMPDIMEEYPVPGPRTLDGVLETPSLGARRKLRSRGGAYADRICQRFGVVHGGAYSAFAEMLSARGDRAQRMGKWHVRYGQLERHVFSCVRSPPERSTPARTPDTADARCGSGTLISPTTKGRL